MEADSSLIGHGSNMMCCYVMAGEILPVATVHSGQCTIGASVFSSLQLAQAFRVFQSSSSPSFPEWAGHRWAPVRQVEEDLGFLSSAVSCNGSFFFWPNWVCATERTPHLFLEVALLSGWKYHPSCWRLSFLRAKLREICHLLMTFLSTEHSLDPAAFGLSGCQGRQSWILWAVGYYAERQKEVNTWRL